MALVDFKLDDIGNVLVRAREALTGEAISNPEEKLKLLQSLQEAEARIADAQAKTISAEASSEHWITSSWRPITMLVFTSIIANNYIIAPYMLAIFNWTIPTLEIPPNMWSLLELGLTGYIVGRSAEKTMQIYKGNK